MFRSLEGDVERKDKPLLQAFDGAYKKDKASYLEQCLMNCTWNKGNALLKSKKKKARHGEARPADEVGDEEVDLEDAGSSNWYIFTAKAIERAGSALIKKLEKGQVIPYWNTWCETDVERARANAYADCVVFFDTKHGPVHFVKTRSPYDNVYVGIRRNLLDAVDPVLEARCGGRI